jgi:hypothetical protein
VTTLMFREPLIQMQRRANIEFPRGLALEDVCGGHFWKKWFPARRDARYLLLFEIW